MPTSVLPTTGYGPNLFALESFIDKLAHLSGRDPYLYRRELLGNDQRALQVLDLAGGGRGKHVGSRYFGELTCAFR